jgi:small GTP-binding protein
VTNDTRLRAQAVCRPNDDIRADEIAGKSSLTVQYCEGHFVESYYPTIENTFSHEIECKGQTFLTEIIDTAGQVRSPVYASAID